MNLNVNDFLVTNFIIHSKLLTLMLVLVYIYIKIYIDFLFFFIFYFLFFLKERRIFMHEF